MYDIIDELIDRNKFTNTIVKKTSFLEKNLKKNKIVIYGAGFAGIMTYKSFLKIGIEPICFADNNKYGNIIENKSIIKPEDIYREYGDVYIIVSMYVKGKIFEDIKNMLKLYGNENIVHIFELRECAQLMNSHPFPLYININELLKNKDKYNKVYSLLEDENSKEIYISLLEFISYNYDTKIKSKSVKEQYLAYDIYSKIENEVFVDCGAFVGEVLDEFTVRVNGFFKEYIAYEPDIDNFRVLSKKIKTKYKYDNIKLYNLAVGDKFEMLKFENFGGSNAIISDNGTCLTKCVAIDEHLEVLPTLIKIDVEGYDKQVLYGAKETIKKYMPVIAVSIYHHVDDLWEIPLWIKDNFPDYKLYIRSYMNYMETVCYAVPPNRIINRRKS